MRLIRLLKNDIAREATEWVDDKIITTLQAEQICDRYGADFHQVNSGSRGYNILMALAYLFIGLALITLIGANWDELPRAPRMWGLIALTIGTQLFALKLYLKSDNNAASALFFLGHLFYGASIILIAQIYHLGEHMPDGVFWWAFGSLPIAVLVRSSWLTLFSLLLSLIWFILEIQLGFYPMLFPVFIISSLYILYKGQHNTLLLLVTAFSLMLWIDITLIELWRHTKHYFFSEALLPINIALLILAYTFSHWLILQDTIKFKKYGTVMAHWVLKSGILCLFILSFSTPWEQLIKTHWEQPKSLLLIISILALLSLLTAYKSSRLIITSIILLVFLGSLILTMYLNHPHYASYFQITYNIVLITSGVYLIVRGISDGISQYFFMGIFTILFTALMRYIDLIGDYVGGATLFIVFALVLLGAAKFWKRQQPKKVTL
jgi:uncharacterized membrane protein